MKKYKRQTWHLKEMTIHIERSSHCLKQQSTDWHSIDCTEQKKKGEGTNMII